MDDLKRAFELWLTEHNEAQWEDLTAIEEQALVDLHWRRLLQIHAGLHPRATNEQVMSAIAPPVGDKPIPATRQMDKRREREAWRKAEEAERLARQGIDE